MYNYAIRFEQDGSAPGVAVFCRDLPELNSYGDDREHALREAADGIESALSIYVDQRRPVPQASAPEPGEQVVYLSSITIAKIALWNEMIARGMRKADLCRLLGVSQTQGDRLVDFTHQSKIDQVENALEAMGMVRPFPYARAQFYYVPFRDPKHYDIQRAWIHYTPGVSKELFDEITFETLLPPDASESLKSALGDAVREKFRCNLYRHCPLRGAARDRGLLDEGGILFNYSSMPAGMLPDENRWIPISPAELQAVDDHAYRHLVGRA
ncbi:hypothetical protein [Pseudomonas sp. B10(2017)]|uniref:type II toxin-antitoxin system HicB family antitoxin n=1 Tax=Pseudomonas sp. B10(2017) TaxID=1981749 RepID=UPI001179E523